MTVCLVNMAYKTHRHWSNDEFLCIGPYSIQTIDCHSTESCNNLENVHLSIQKAKSLLKSSQYPWCFTNQLLRNLKTRLYSKQEYSDRFGKHRRRTGTGNQKDIHKV